MHDNLLPLGGIQSNTDASMLGARVASEGMNDDTMMDSQIEGPVSSSPISSSTVPNGSSASNSSSSNSSGSCDANRRTVLMSFIKYMCVIPTYDSHMWFQCI